MYYYLQFKNKSFISKQQILIWFIALRDRSESSGDDDTDDDDNFVSSPSPEQVTIL